MNCFNFNYYDFKIRFIWFTNGKHNSISSKACILKGSPRLCNLDSHPHEVDKILDGLNSDVSMSGDFLDSHYLP